MQISQAAICSTTLGYPAVSVNPVFRSPPHTSLRDIVYASQRVLSGTCPGELHHMETLYSSTLASRVGPLFLATSGKGLVALEFDARLPGQQTIRPNPRDLRAEAASIQFAESATAMSPYVRELEEYFAGRRRTFDFQLDLRGTDFQLACWHALIAIPYGETRS